MACLLFVTKPLHKPVYTYYWLDVKKYSEI